MNGLFIGSFDMFTNGHLETLEQAVPLFDTIFVVLAHNPLKSRTYTIESCKNAIKEAIINKVYSDKIIITDTDLLAVYFALNNGCQYLIRGIRNSTDYQYEEIIAAANNELCGTIQTIYFRSKHPEISSTMIREFIRYNIDVAKYLPYDISILEREGGAIKW